MPVRRSPLPICLTLALCALAALLVAGTAGARAAAVTIAPGDTLGAIAARNGTTVAALASANGIADPDRIVAGARLTVPGGGGSAGPADAGGSYRVRSGDTLGAIAARNGTSVAAIAALNGIANPNMVAAGRSLRLPASSGATAGRPVGMASINPGGPEVGALIDRMATRHGVPASLARAVGWQESRWSQSALSHAGAVGVMQLMPETARWFGPAVLGRRINPHRIDDNVEGGVAYIGWLLRQTGGRERLAVGSYYQGLGATRTRGFYEDTKDYVASVMTFRGRV